MSTYRFRCKCGEWSPKLASKESMHAWHAGHKRDSCVARRSSSTPARRVRPVDAELQAKLAWARQHLKPLPMPEEPAEQAAAPRRIVKRFWVGVRRFGAIKEVIVTAPPARNNWGAPIR
jgi:hypothetical protein